MLNVDISNIWGSASLPELLACEEKLFAAHGVLTEGAYPYLSFLGQKDTISGAQLTLLRETAETVHASSDVLVVVGTGLPVLCARAVLELRRTSGAKKPQIMFAGDHFSAEDWMDLTALLDGKDFSLHIVSPNGGEVETMIAVRALRWMMEQRYGSEAKKRVSVSTYQTDSVLYRMAKEEGYVVFSLSPEVGSRWSGLTPAALLPLAVAGVDPEALLRGAAEGYREWAVRSFENPAWMYAGARTVLLQKGIEEETLCAFTPTASALGQWWRRLFLSMACRNGKGLLTSFSLLPQDLHSVGASRLENAGRLLHTMVRFSGTVPQVPVEMDWKDTDGLNHLYGKTLDYVENRAFDCALDLLTEAGMPVVTLDCASRSEGELGGLVYFFELSAALSAVALSKKPLEWVGKTSFNEKLRGYLSI